MSVFVFIEHRDGKLNRVSLEALTAGRTIASHLGTNVCAVVPGSGSRGVADEAARYGTDEVVVLDNPALSEYTADGYTAALEQLIRPDETAIVVFPHTYQTRDYAPKLAARFGRPLISDIIGIKTAGADVVFVRQLFQGKLNAEIAPSAGRIFVSVQAGAFRPAEVSGAAAPVTTLPVHLNSQQIRSKPEPPFQEAARSVDLSAAEYIVSVGRGIKEEGNLPVVEALAEALGAELAASRPICDNGWLPMERQVGSSGQTVAPKLYVAVGLSGAIQHLVGMKGSRTVVAINKDETAPIFEVADYGIVGDLFEVVPALVEEIRKAKG
jgi:electron transfer flavoprotein alpha subunit